MLQPLSTIWSTDDESCEEGVKAGINNLGGGSLGILTVILTKGFSGVRCSDDVIIVEEAPWHILLGVLIEVWSCQEFTLQMLLPPKTIAGHTIRNDFFSCVNFWGRIDFSLQPQPIVQESKFFLVICLSLVRSRGLGEQIQLVEDVVLGLQAG